MVIVIRSFFDRHLTTKTSDKKERLFDLSEVIFKIEESADRNLVYIGKMKFYLYNNIC